MKLNKVHETFDITEFYISKKDGAIKIVCEDCYVDTSRLISLQLNIVNGKISLDMESYGASALNRNE